MSRKRFPPRHPRLAAGIRAQALRGGDTRAWATRWRQAVEAMGLGPRFGRARAYALSGQVTELTIAGSAVRAQVVGSRLEPYRVALDFREPPPDRRRRIVAALRAEPMLVARLLADDLPFEVEELFRLEGLDLFPGGKLAPGKYDVTISCSCPDWANPCKHAAAVLLLLGEEVARRPATLLELRGIPLEELYDEAD